MLIFSICIKAQNITEAVFKVTNYSIDGVNYDDVAIEGNAALAFYWCDESDDSDICFANVFRSQNSQSYGSVSGISKKHFDETNQYYEVDTYQFTWNYSNTFDEVTGMASVELSKIFINDMVKMTAKILVLETNEVLEFVGYLEK